MDLRLLEYFVAVVDNGGVTRAANALFLSQPSLSQAIRSLEREVGTPLFDRTNRQLELTTAGKDFLAPARRVLAEADRARTKVGDVRELDGGRLKIAAIATLTLTPLSELAGRLHALHPGVEFVIDDPGSAVGVTAAVRRGAAEVGVTTLSVDTSPLVGESLWTDRVMLAVHPALVPGLPDPVPIDALRDIPLVLEVDDEQGDTLADPVLRGAIGPDVIRCAHRQAIWELVGAGAGGTLLPERHAQRILSGVELRPLQPEVRRSSGIVHRPGQLSPAAQAFVELARASADR